MRKAALIYNPQSGRKLARSLAAAETAAAEFRSAGVEAVLIPTTAPGSAAEQAREAVAGGCDTVVVCGGDGTVNDALQGLAGTRVALGIVPLGTGNVIATYLGIPRRPEAAARALLRGSPHNVLLGRIASAKGNRYFLAAAGVGADAQIMYRAVAAKPRLGLAAYYLEGLKMFFTHRFPPFVVEFTGQDGRHVSEIVSQVVAARIGSFPGLLADIVPGAGFDRNDFRLLLVRTPRHLPYLKYMIGVALRRPWLDSAVALAYTRELLCRELGDAEALPPQWRRHKTNIHAEVDGDPLARLPVTLSVGSETIRLILP